LRSKSSKESCEEVERATSRIYSQNYIDSDPLVPMALYHKLLVALGYEFFADAKNLNLLSRSSLARVARAAGIDRFEITSVSLLGLPTNLLLIAGKRD
jgi:hypothetical protein